MEGLKFKVLIYAALRTIVNVLIYASLRTIVNVLIYASLRTIGKAVQGSKFKDG